MSKRPNDKFGPAPGPRQLGNGSTVTCPYCQGWGHVRLSNLYTETLKLVAHNPGLNGAALGRIAGCKETAMNNRLRGLENHGFIVGEWDGRQRTWTVKPGARTDAKVP